MKNKIPNIYKHTKKQKYPLGTKITINGVPYTYCKKVKNENK
jgi:hypothetical protein